MIWEPGKEYRTRDGNRARVYATDGRDPWNIHGAIFYEDLGGWDPTAWRSDGKVTAPKGQRQYDLMPPAREVWLWETPNGSLDGMVCSSEDDVHVYVQNNFKDRPGRPVLFREVLEGDDE